MLFSKVQHRLTHIIWKLFHTLKKELPCILNPTQCKNDGECTDDNKGSYTCTCPNGYTGTNCDIG